MNSIAYKDIVLLDGPDNFFRLEIGVLPSYGIFRVDSTILEQLKLTQNEPGKLEFITKNSAGERVEDQCVTLYNIYLVKAVIARAGIESVKITKDSRGLTTTETIPANHQWDMTLADGRILWDRTYSYTNYNMLYPAPTINPNTGRVIGYDAENTYREVYTAMTALLASRLPYQTVFEQLPESVVKRTPQNYPTHLPYNYLLHMCLKELWCYLCPDLQAEPINYLPKLLEAYDADSNKEAWEKLQELINLYSRPEQLQLHYLNSYTNQPMGQVIYMVRYTMGLPTGSETGTLPVMTTKASKTFEDGFGYKFQLSPHIHLASTSNPEVVEDAYIEEATEALEDYAKTRGNIFHEKHVLSGFWPLKLGLLHTITWQGSSTETTTTIEAGPVDYEKLPPVATYALHANTYLNRKATVRISISGVPVENLYTGSIYNLAQTNQGAFSCLVRVLGCKGMLPTLTGKVVVEANYVGMLDNVPLYETTASLPFSIAVG